MRLAFFYGGPGAAGEAVWNDKIRAAATALLPQFQAQRRLAAKGIDGLSAEGAFKLVRAATGSERQALDAMNSVMHRQFLEFAETMEPGIGSIQ